MNHEITSETEHLRMIPMTLADSECFRKLRNREDNRKWFIYKDVITKEAQEKWFQQYLTKDSEYMFSVYTNEGKKTFLGAASIYDIDLQLKKAEIGRIIIDRQEAAGKGYGLEVVKGLIDISFHLLKLEMIYANIYEDNLASIKTFQRAGLMVKEKKTDINGKVIVYLEKKQAD